MLSVLGLSLLILGVIPLGQFETAAVCFLFGDLGAVLMLTFSTRVVVWVNAVGS